MSLEPLFHTSTNLYKTMKWNTRNTLEPKDTTKIRTWLYKLIQNTPQNHYNNQPLHFQTKDHQSSHPVPLNPLPPPALLRRTPAGCRALTSGRLVDHGGYESRKKTLPITNYKEKSGADKLPALLFVRSILKANFTMLYFENMCLWDMWEVSLSLSDQEASKD